MPDFNTEKICYVILKAREFDVKVEIVEPDPGGNSSDSDAGEVLQDYADDPTFHEIKVFIDDLNVDEQIDLVALTWLGRGDYTVSEWDEACAEARRARDEVRTLCVERHVQQGREGGAEPLDCFVAIQAAHHGTRGHRPRARALPGAPGLT